MKMKTRSKSLNHPKLVAKIATNILEQIFLYISSLFEFSYDVAVIKNQKIIHDGHELRPASLKLHLTSPQDGADCRWVLKQTCSVKLILTRDTSIDSYCCLLIWVSRKRAFWCWKSIPHSFFFQVELPVQIGFISKVLLSWHQGSKESPKLNLRCKIDWQSRGKECLWKECQDFAVVDTLWSVFFQSNPDSVQTAYLFFIDRASLNRA